MKTIMNGESEIMQKATSQ